MKFKEKAIETPLKTLSSVAQAIHEKEQALFDQVEIITTPCNRKPVIKHDIDSTSSTPPKKEKPKVKRSRASSTLTPKLVRS
jgi:hypothetical protein